MTRLALDGLILMMISRELHQLAANGYISLDLFLISLIGLPFFFGMGSDPAYLGVQSPIDNGIRNFIRTGLSWALLILFLRFEIARGTLWIYASYFLIAVLCYLVGRYVGMAWNFLWFIIGVVIVILVAGALFSP